MRGRDIEETLYSLLQQGVSNEVFPGAAAAVSFPYKKKRKTLYARAGNAALVPAIIPVHQDTCYDLASLTKPLVTALTTLSLVKQKKISLTDEISAFFGELVQADKKAITVHMLLTHSSGLPAHREYFKKLLFVKKGKRQETIIKNILDEKLSSRPGSGCVYSDLGFILLVAFGRPLLSILLSPGLSLGILLGALTIVSCWILSIAYVVWANRGYDQAVARAVAASTADSGRKS